MKKIFGEINLSWKKIIILAIVVGVSVGLINSVVCLKDTSFTDSAIYFDFWIVLGIIIIMNAKSNLDSALKCFVFFLISQPLIYLVEVPFSHLGWQLFTYYKFWFMWTIFCLPMGYIGYYIKKNKWWGLIILAPMMFLLGTGVSTHLNNMMFSFPKHLISYLFCVAFLIILPLCIFNDKKLKKIGLVIGIVLILVFSIIRLLNRPVYETQVLCNNYEHPINESHKAYLEDSKYGSVKVMKIPELDDYCVDAKFVRNGKTKLIIEAQDGSTRVFDLEIERNTYHIDEIK